MRASDPEPEPRGSAGRDLNAVRLRAGWTSAVLGVVVFGGKYAAYALTGSAAVFSDAMESVVNLVAAGVLVFSLGVAALPADRNHPSGAPRPRPS